VPLAWRRADGGKKHLFASLARRMVCPRNAPWLRKFIRGLSPLSCSVAARCSNEVTKSIKVNTRILNKVELACLFNLVAQSDLLDYYKPKETINDFSSGELNKKGKFVLHNARFKSRVRPSQLVRRFFFLPSPQLFT
jgi:hypothetical protein